MEPDGPFVLRGAADDAVEGRSQPVTADSVRAYVAATSDDASLYERLSLAPPVYPAVVLFPPFRDLLFRVMPPTLLGSSVHLAQFMRFHRHLRPGEVVTSRASVVHTRATPFGCAICFYGEVLGADGEVVNESYHDVMLRGVRAEPSGAEPPRPRFMRTPDTRRLGDVRFDIAADQSVRYSHASGDIHPIHNDIGIARKAGFPDLILHGMCTFALCGQAAVRFAAGGDPTRLAGLGATFTHPVIVGRPLVVSVDGGADGQAGVVGRQMGRQVTRYGIAEVTV